jgi:cob(I)alamin adenosyltransferase
MKHRLTRIVTRTGDNGETSLADGSRLPKDHPRIEALGEIDELNSMIGWLLTHELPQALNQTLQKAQHLLFEAGAELAMPGRIGIRPADVELLETQLESLNAELPPLREFVLPGGAPAAALCHMARAICRRAERRVVAVGDNPNPELLRFLNRLSDWLFVAARVLARQQNPNETLWARE